MYAEWQTESEVEWVPFILKVAFLITEYWEKKSCILVWVGRYRGRILFIFMTIYLFICTLYHLQHFQRQQPCTCLNSRMQHIFYSFFIVISTWHAFFISEGDGNDDKRVWHDGTVRLHDDMMRNAFKLCSLQRYPTLLNKGLFVWHDVKTNYSLYSHVYFWCAHHTPDGQIGKKNSPVYVISFVCLRPYVNLPFFLFEKWEREGPGWEELHTHLMFPIWPENVIYERMRNVYYNIYHYVKSNHHHFSRTRVYAS